MESDRESFDDEGPPHYYDGLKYNTYCKDRKCFLDSEQFTFFDIEAQKIKCAPCRRKVFGLGARPATARRSLSQPASSLPAGPATSLWPQPAPSARAAACGLAARDAFLASCRRLSWR